MDGIDCQHRLTTSGLPADSDLAVAAQMEVEETSSDLAHLDGLTDPIEEELGLEQVELITQSDPGSEETVILDVADIKVEPEEPCSLQGDQSPLKYGVSGQPQQKRGPGRPRKDGQSPKPWKKQHNRVRTNRKSRIGAILGPHGYEDGGVLGAEALAASVESAVPQVLAHLKQETSLVLAHLKQDPAQMAGRPSADLDLGGDDSGDSGNIQLPPQIERTISEDSFGSEFSLSFGSVCALCNRGEKSLLGQGDLMSFKCTVGFNPFKKQFSNSRRGSSETDELKSGEKSPKHLTWRRPRGPPKPNRDRNGSKSPRRPNPHSLQEEEIRTVANVDELSLVGLPEETDVSQIFDKNGLCWAHFCCAAWSEGVIQAEDLSLQYVDKAAFSGLSNKCLYCRRFGATIICRYPKCNKIYHYPCASGGGCFQDIKTLSLLCPDHTDQAETIAGQEAYCVVCDNPGQILEQLFCTSCGQHYHGNCLDPPVEVNPIVRAGWQCPECKICQTCRQPGDDNKMLVCDTCDKGYHTFCLKPVMTTIPKNGWKCKNCRVCGDCGARTPGSGPSSRWHLNYSVCDSCYQQRNKGLSCPLCGKAYRQFTQKQMVQCNMCKKFVHSECDESIDIEAVKRAKGGQFDYTCPVCKNRDASDIELGNFPDQLGTIMDEESLQDIEGFGIFKGLKDGGTTPTRGDSIECEELIASSQESPFLTESSISSMDIDINMLEKGAQQFASSSVGVTNISGTIATASSMSLSSPGHSTPAMSAGVPPGPGMGRPSFGKKFGKKIGGSRPRARTLGPGKKKGMGRGPVERKRGPKPKLKQCGGTGYSIDAKNSDDDPSSTTIIVSSKDKFSLHNDVCYSCGTIGKDEEGKLVVCTQCGQCYHPYCVSIKVSKVVLQKGWRCLDCTVCEGCGKPHDEGRLILCDECDISYHIYCLDPPLDHVPKGTWKCKWCVVCVTCGATTPGLGCQWQNNYSQCGPCSSNEYCHVCYRNYLVEDLIIKCARCDRWFHAGCDGLKNEDEAELASDYGYNCSDCRAHTGCQGPLPPPPPPSPEPVSPSPPPTPPPPLTPRENIPPKPMKTFFLDGVLLSENGLNLIKSQSVKLSVKRRPRRSRPSDHLNKASGLTRLLSEEDIEADIKGASADLLDGEEIKSELMGEDGRLLSPNHDRHGSQSGEPGTPQDKKRKRMRFGTGVGGFMVKHRARGGHTLLSRRLGLSKSQGQGSLPLQMGLPDDDGDPKFDVEEPGMSGDGKKKRRRQRPKPKSQLEDNFPVYLQEAFFGKPLIDKSKESDLGSMDVLSDHEDGTASPSDSILHTSSTLDTKESFELSESGEKKDVSLGGGQSSSAGLTSLAGGPSTTKITHEDGDKDHPMDEEELKNFLPTDLPDEDIMALFVDKMPDTITHEHEHLSQVPAVSKVHGVLDQNLLSINPSDIDGILGHVAVDDIQQLDSKTVEDLFKDVSLLPQQTSSSVPLIPQQSNTSDSSYSLPPLPGSSTPAVGGCVGVNRLLSQGPPGGLTGLGGEDTPQETNTPSSSMSPFSMPSPSPNVQPDSYSLGFPSETSGPGYHQQLPAGMSPQSLPRMQTLPGVPPLPPGSAAPPGHPAATGEEPEQETLSYNKRNIQKWEKDEPLGEMATISPVLYANLQFPELKMQYPEWSERSKQIAKMWRKCPADQKPPFLAKARENRANLRLQKAQKVTDAVKKRNQPSVSKMAPPPVPAPKTPTTPTGGDGSPHQQLALTAPETDKLSEQLVEDGSQIQPPSSGNGFGKPNVPRPPPSDDPYAHPPGTPHPGLSQGYIPYPPGVGPKRTLEGGAMQAGPHDDVFKQPPPPPPPQPQVSRSHDPYAMQPGTPRPGSAADHIHIGNRQQTPPDPYSQQPGTPMSLHGSEAFGPVVRPSGPRERFGPLTSLPGSGNIRSPEGNHDTYLRSPTTPTGTPSQDPFGPVVSSPVPSPGTPGDHFPQRPVSGMGQFTGQRLAGPYPRIIRPDPFSPPAPGPLTPVSEGFPRPPLPPRSGASEGYSQVPTTPHQEEDLPPLPPQMMAGGQPPFMQEQGPAGPVHPMFRRPPTYGINRAWPYAMSQYYADGDKNKNPGQVKELLAKHTKKRQSQKKQQLEEQDRMLREGGQGQIPLRHWPEEGQQYPPGAMINYPGEMVGPRGPPPSQYHGAHPQIAPIRWSEESLRQPMPVRPDGEGFGPRGSHVEMGMRVPFVVRQMRPPGPGFPVPGGPGAPYPPQFTGQRMPGQMMEFRHQMFQERLRQTEATMGGARQQTSPHVSPQPGSTSPRFPARIPTQIHPGQVSPGQQPTAVPRMSGNPLDPYDHMVHPGQGAPTHPQPVHSHVQHPVRPNGHRMPFAPPATFPPSSPGPLTTEPSKVNQTSNAGQALNSLVSNTGPAKTPSTPKKKVTSGNGSASPSPKTGEQSPQVKQSSPTEKQKRPAEAPPTQPPQAGGTSTHPPKENEGADHLEDLLDADGSFNLLEYADPELDSTLTEELDRSMFDEHLGIKKEEEENGTDTQLPSQARPSPAPARSKAYGLVKARPAASDSSHNLPARSTSTAAQISEPAQIQTADQIKKESPEDNTICRVQEKNAVQEDQSAKVPESSVSTSLSQDGPKTPPSASDFQAKFLEFSQRKSSETSTVEGLEESKTSKGLTPTKDSKPVTRSKSPKGQGGATPPKQANPSVKGDTLPQVDGCYDEMLSPSPLLEIDGYQKPDLLSEDDDTNCENCEACREVRLYCFSPIPMQVDGPNDGEPKESVEKENKETSGESGLEGTAASQPPNAPAPPSAVNETSGANVSTVSTAIVTGTASTTQSTNYASSAKPVSPAVAAPSTQQKSPVTKPLTPPSSFKGPTQQPVVQPPQGAPQQQHSLVSQQPGIGVSNAVSKPAFVNQSKEMLVSSHLSQAQSPMVQPHVGAPVHMHMLPGHPYPHPGARPMMGIPNRPQAPPQMGQDVRSPLGPPPPYPGGHPMTNQMLPGSSGQPGMMGPSPHQSPRPGQSPHHAQSPHTGQSPHQIQSPHHGTSPHATQHPHPGSSPRPGMSPHPVQSPHPRPSPHPGTPQPGGSQSQQQAMPSPHSAGHSPHPGASPQYSVTSPHPLSRSGTPQLVSPRTPVGSQPTTPQGAPPGGFIGQPGTPQGMGHPGQNGGSAPGTPTAIGPSGHPTGLQILTQGGQPGVSQAQFHPVSSTMTSLSHPPSSQALSQQQFMQQQQQLMYSMQQGQMPLQNMGSMGPSVQPAQSSAGMVRAGFPPGMRPGMPPQSMPPGHPYPPAQTTLTTSPGSTHSTIGALLNQQRPMGQQQMVMPPGSRPPVPMGQTQAYPGQMVSGQGGTGQRMPFPMGPNQRPPPHMFQHKAQSGGPRPGMPPPHSGLRQMAPNPQYPGMPAQSQAQMMGPQGMQGHPGHSRMMFNPRGMPPGQRMMSTPPNEMPGQQGLPGQQGPGIPGPHGVPPGQGISIQPVMPGQQGPRPGPSPTGYPPHTAPHALPQRPLLLQEQPLLLEDLLEQKSGQVGNTEKQEQRRQAEQQAMMQKQQGGQPPSSQSQQLQPGQTAGDSSAILTDADYEKLSVDVMGDGVTQPVRGQGQGASQPPPVTSAVLAQPSDQQHPVIPGQQHPLQHGQLPMTSQTQRLQHTEGPWPKDTVSPGMSSVFQPRGQTPQLSPRTPSPFPVPSPGTGPGMMTSHSPALQSPTMQAPVVPPPRPAAPPPKGPGEPITPEERAAHQQYDDWVMQQASFLGNQVRMMENTVGKHRKTKKSLNAKQRQAKKSGNELSEEDAKLLEITSTEQSRLQKQLEALRKQQRAHTQLLQDYKSKQQERFGHQWTGPPGMPVMRPQGPAIMQQHTGGIPNASASNSVGPNPGQPRMPGASQPMRLPPAARQEYEAYMQGRLRMMQPGGRGTQLLSGVRGPVDPACHKLPLHQNYPNLTVVQPHVPTMVAVKDENNPFSESYQQREHMQKLQQQEQQRIQMQRHVEQQRALQQMEGGEGPDRQLFSPDGQPQRFAFPQDGSGPRFHAPRYPLEGQQHMAGPRMPGPESIRPPYGVEGPRVPNVGMMTDQSPEGQMKGVRFNQPSPNTSRAMFPQGQGPGFSSPPQTPQQAPGELFGGGGTPGSGSTPGTPTASTPTIPPTTPSVPPIADNLAADPANSKKRKRRRKKKNEPQPESDMSSINISMPYVPPIPGEAPLGPGSRTPTGAPPGQHPMMGPRGPMFAGQQMMPGSMGPRPPHMVHGMAMSPGPYGVKKEAGQPSGMSELQKLVNMQPQVIPPDVTLRAQTPGSSAMSNQPLSSAGQALLTSSQAHMSKTGEGLRIPATQHVPPQLGSALDVRTSEAQDKMDVHTLGELERMQAFSDQEAKANQNVLLKQLLNMRKQGQGDREASVGLSGVLPVRLPNEEEETALLTPEQQRQLQLIENMPLTMEKEISQDEWDKKTPEEKEKIMDSGTSQLPPSELRRQEFEMRRKELAETSIGKKPQQRQRKKRKDTEGKEPAKKKKKKESGAGLAGIPGPVTPTKSEEIDHAAITEQIMASLRALPALALQEPEVHVNHAICPVTGTPSVTNIGENQLQGLFGKSLLEGMPDFYNNFPFGAAGTASVRELLQQGGTINEETVHRMTTDIAARRRLIGDALGGDQERYNIMPRLQDAISTPESIIGILGQHSTGGSLQERLVMPSPPLIEPRQIPSRASDASPATIIYSSSPECTAEENLSGVHSKYTGLKLISMEEGKSEEEKDRECSSPSVPVICPVPIKASPVVNGEVPPEVISPVVQPKEKTKGSSTEPSSASPPQGEASLRNKMSALSSALAGRPLKDPQNSQLSLTLNINHPQSEDIGGVISAIADLLKIAVPPPYDVNQSRSPSPDPQKMPFGTIQGATHKEEAINIQHLIKSRPRFCRHCDSVVLSAGVRKKKSDLPYLKTTENKLSFVEDDDVSFCSMNCYMQFDIAHRHVAEPAPVEPAKPEPVLVEVKQEVGDGSECREERVKPLIIRVPPDAQIPVTSCQTPRRHKEKRRRSSSASGQEPPKALIKKWKGQKYKNWDPIMVRNDKVINPPSEQEVSKFMERLGTVIRPTKWKDDRLCVLCGDHGDGDTDGPGRLLNMDAHKYVHLNCALWSYEVYETMNGSLVNVDQAVKRGSTLECVSCCKKGATVGCFKLRCSNIYHVSCAQAEGVMFFQDKTVLCPMHASKIVENELTCISVYRRVYINRDENRQVASIIHQEEKKYTVRVGALVIHNIGQLLPHQIQTGRFNTRDYIYPVGFKSTRFYWSFRQINKRCRYICKIDDTDGRPDFIVTVIEEGFDKTVLKDETCKGVWLKILEPLEKLKRDNDLVKMFPSYIPGEELFGLTDSTVLKAAESLPGIELLTNYSFKYGRSPLYELPLAINPTGCARSEPKLRTHFKRPHTLHSSSNSRSLPSTVTVVPGDVNSPYMKQFVHSKSQQYRRLKTEWRNNVYLRRSNIQGLGLFATRDLEKHTMVIEYIGELIRNEVAETREKYYEQQNRGVYMFRIDDNIVVDATMAGGPARYINHSCNPNCVAEVVPFEKDSKIIIIAKRRIARGEELTYDYKFDFEDDQHKIPCGCGAANCRKWMN